MYTLVVIAVCFYSHGSSAIYLNNGSSTKHFEDNPAKWTEDGIWGPLLEEWILTDNRREKRVLKFTPLKIDIVAAERISESIDDKDALQSKISPGKVVTKKPVPGRQVSETDLYLLGAIEKMVYRMDFMEKRLRKVEEMMYYVMAGNRIDQETCPDNFTRIGHGCYLIWSNAGRELDWKAANKQCRQLGATLAEMETIEENQDVVAHIQTTAYFRGKDFWTGGLNPGLLWIWSHSARPVSSPGSNKKNPSAAIFGDGRCLRLSYDPALRTYSYKGTDCSMRYSFICELPETTSSNEITRIGRSKHIFSDEL